MWKSFNRNSSIQLIDGNIAATVEAATEFLTSTGYKTDCQKITKDNAYIKGSNLQRGILKLYISNSPQIIHWRIKQISAEQLQIESEFEHFGHFELIHHVCLFCSLCCFSFGFSMQQSHFFYQFISSYCFGGLFINKWLYFLFYAFSLIISVGLVAKVVVVNNKNFFLGEFYKTLFKKGLKNKIDIQTDIGIRGAWKSIILFFGFTVATMIIAGSPLTFIKESPTMAIFLGGLILVAIILSALVLQIVLNPFTAEKSIFLLMGLIICTSLTLHSNVPSLLSVSDKFSQVVAKMREIERITASSSGAMAEWETFKKQSNKMEEMKKNFGAVFIGYFGVWLLLFGFIICFYIVMFNVPIDMLKSQRRFEFGGKESIYIQSLQPENTSYVLNILILFLWITISLAFLFGFYCTSTVFERTILGFNFIFKSEFGIAFFENTKAMLEMFGHIIGGAYSPLFHRLFMLLYSLPVIALFILVLQKRIESTLTGYCMLQKLSGRHHEITSQLSEKVGGICRFANVLPPTVLVLNSSDINAETRYLGFPVFKNILTISKGTWGELSVNEDELDVLLAHEVWHIKKHTLARRMLCLLSDYSLFGNGFLALFQNSYRIEKEADAFAVKWVMAKYQDAGRAMHSLKSLLERREEINWRNRMFRPGSSLSFGMLRNDSYRNDLLKSFDTATRIERLKINLKLLYQMYFGEEILSYFHPSISQRVAWIEETYRTNEAN